MLRSFFTLCCATLTLLLASEVIAQDWKEAFATPYELGDGWDSADYETGIKFYRRLAKESDHVTMQAMGPTDSGFPLHLVLLSDAKRPSLESIRSGEKPILLIINAIHPGEPDGVDASMALARDLVFDTEKSTKWLEKVSVAIVPFYNIGGALNRNSGTRANQNGPREYGFRGNAKNYDLNRDFVKCDTLNARSFAEIFHSLDPDLFIDTHVSNGADYQHVMTFAHSQSDKLGLKLGEYLISEFEPKLFGRMKDAGFPSVPYVNSGGQPPEKGFSQFLETPRYSTGYTGLFQTMGFMSETHMLKPYPQRVSATRAFLNLAIELLAEDGSRIKAIRKSDRDTYRQLEEVPIAWRVDRDKPSQVEFLGYESSYIESKVTPGMRLFYDRSRPFEQEIPFYNRFASSRSVKLPKAYLIPSQWKSVIDLFKLNRIEMDVIDGETEYDCEVYRIESTESRTSPYEGHFFHDQVTVSSKQKKVTARPGDVLVSTNQARARYVVETLEPEAMDSFFRWNYFDSILQRKEYFSPYVFEETAEQMLEQDDDLRAEFEKQKEDDPEFAESRRAQLSFLYQRSKHNEDAYRVYPIVRVIK
ncbi:MAG: M14 family metallopeptidase [Planctomycetota bacterium]